MSKETQPRSPCFGLRKRHYFGQLKNNPDVFCLYCGKTKRRVKEEQRGAYGTKFFQEAMKKKMQEIEQKELEAEKQK